MQLIVCIATLTKVNINFGKPRLIFVTFSLICCLNCCEVYEVNLHLMVLMDNGTCGSGSLANALDKANWMCNQSCEQIHVVVCHLHASCALQLAKKQAASHRLINSNKKYVVANQNTSSNNIYAL